MKVSSLRTRKFEDPLSRAQMGAVHALLQLLDLRDYVTGLHARRLVDSSVELAILCGVPDEQLRDIEIAALLHDIGKVGVPDATLMKSGVLSDSERRVMQLHPAYGSTILKSIPGLEQVSRIVLHHHERWDGQGYPEGLAGEDIPVGSRIIAISDMFDAMMNARSYRPALDLDEALGRLTAARGNQLDPTITDNFLSLADPKSFPAGMRSPTRPSFRQISFSDFA
ncbi:MAG: HD-GYP domain-containing protein [Thermoanaerobaculia bacterium]